MSNGVFVANKYLRDKKLNSNEKLVMGYLVLFNKYYYDEENNLLTNKKVAIELGMSDSSIANILNKLEEKGYIKVKFVYHKKTMIKLGKKVDILK